MNIELVVTDLDGTLWHDATDVHPRTRSALAALSAAGISVLVATGRRVGSTRQPLRELGMAPPAVVLNGALGLDLATGERFHRGGFTPGEAVVVLETYHRFEVEPCVYVDDDERPVWVSTAPSTHPEHLRSFGAEAFTDDLELVVERSRVLAFGVLGIPETSSASLADRPGPQPRMRAFCSSNSSGDRAPASRRRTSCSSRSRSSFASGGEDAAVDDTGGSPSGPPNCPGN